MGALVVNIPAEYNSDIEIVKNIPYGDDTLQSLDIYIPKADETVRSAPIIVFFYGGGWTKGSKDLYRFVGSAFAEKGYIVIIPDYRKYPQVKYPAFVEDGALAIKWIKNNIAKYGGTLDGVSLMGHSAGAHTATMLAANEKFLTSVDVENSYIKKAVALSGPYDFIPKEEKYKNIFSDLKTYDQMQITTFIDGTEPPMLLIYGNKDNIVGAQNHQKLSKRLRENNVEFDVKLYDNLDHVGTIKSLTWVYRNKNTLYADILKFLKENN